MRDFVILLPEVFLAITLAGLIAGEIGYHGERVRLISVTALIGLFGAFVQTLLTYKYGATQVFGHVLTIDGLSLFFKLFFIALAALAIVTASYSREITQEKRTEFCTLVVASCLAMCLAASAADMLVAFLALQFMNVLGYFLAAFGRRSLRSTEAAVKHLAFGAVAGALFLYSIAILFASTHGVNIYEMHRALVAQPMNPETSLVVFMLMFLSFCFQFGAFPMYLWQPDVLEGAPTPVSAFLSLGTRAAGFAVATRFLIVLFAQPAAAKGQWQVLGTLDWTKIAALVSGLTMIIGALMAFRQTAAKRLVSCLVVAESGYLLLGLLVLDEVGVAAILYNFVVQLFALMGAFYVIAFIVDELKSDQLQDLRGMLARAVPECICLVLFLACLVGLPPLPGFIGKFTLVGAAIRHQWYFLAVIALISTAVSTAAIARLAFALVGDFRKMQSPAIEQPPIRRALLAALLVPMALVGIFADQVLSLAGQSLRFILW